MNIIHKWTKLSHIHCISDLGQTFPRTMRCSEWGRKKREWKSYQPLINFLTLLCLTLQPGGPLHSFLPICYPIYNENTAWEEKHGQGLVRLLVTVCSWGKETSTFFFCSPWGKLQSTLSQNLKHFLSALQKWRCHFRHLQQCLPF